MKLDAQTLLMLALVAFVFFNQQKKPLLKAEVNLQLEDLLKVLQQELKNLKVSVAQVQTRVNELHNIKPVPAPTSGW